MHASDVFVEQKDLPRHPHVGHHRHVHPSFVEDASPVLALCLSSCSAENHPLFHLLPLNFASARPMPLRLTLMTLVCQLAWLSAFYQCREPPFWDLSCSALPSPNGSSRNQEIASPIATKVSPIGHLIKFSPLNNRRLPASSPSHSYSKKESGEVCSPPGFCELITLFSVSLYLTCQCPLKGPIPILPCGCWQLPSFKHRPLGRISPGLYHPHTNHSFYFPVGCAV